eukprot:Em0023g874a
MERRPKTCVEAGEFADVSPTIENITSVATYDLASIRPDAVIVNQVEANSYIALRCQCAKITCRNGSTRNLFQGCYSPIMLTFLEPAKVPVAISKHSNIKPFKLGSAMIVSMDTWHGKPELMGPLLAALRYVPQVPIEEGRGGWHKGAWANDIMLEVLGQGLMEVNTHLVLEVLGQGLMEVNTHLVLEVLGQGLMEVNTHLVLEVLGQGLMEVNTHLVLEVVPATVQVHDTMAPGQMGWEREASHLAINATTQAHVINNIKRLLHSVDTIANQ